MCAAPDDERSILHVSDKVAHKEWIAVGAALDEGWKLWRKVVFWVLLADVLFDILNGQEI